MSNSEFIRMGAGLSLMPSHKVLSIDVDELFFGSTPGDSFVANLYENAEKFLLSEPCDSLGGIQFLPGEKVGSYLSNYFDLTPGDVEAINEQIVLY